MLPLRASLLFCLVWGVATSGCTPGPRVEPPDCAESRAHVAVHSNRHELLLCDGGAAKERFDVRLAKHGNGKTREGDGKLPLGRYSLGVAVRSDRFGLFLPIGYPTPAQRAQGMTGSAVGVHGPAREVQFLGGLVNTFDTTDGCVGLASDAEVQRVSDFVRTRRADVIVID